MIRFFSKFKIIFYCINFFLIFLYLFPGSLMGLIIYNDKKIQPQITQDFIISSNHFYVFVILSIVAFLSFIKTKEIKPKIKPKLKISETNNSISDLQIEPKVKKETIVENKKDQITKPKPKPEEDFSIASMLKDLRNEKSNNITEENVEEEDKNNSKNTENNEGMILSISEIDLLRQQLSSCWNAPAGAEIERGMKVSISAKVRQNMRVFENSVRIVDTNISKSNPFYGPITDSAMRTLLNPECTPLKLPINKYKLWKNLTITFDYSIMKGF